MLKRLPIIDYSSVCFAVHKISNFNGKLVSKIGNFMRSMLSSNKTKNFGNEVAFKIISLFGSTYCCEQFLFKDET